MNRLMRLTRSLRVGIRHRSSFVVPDRAYIEVLGPDSVKLLQGICTNNVTDLGAQWGCIAAAFLTPKGRVLADTLIYDMTAKTTDDSLGSSSSAPSSPPSHLVIETHESMLSSLTKFLTMYRLRSKATIKISADYQTIVTLPGQQSREHMGSIGKELSLQDPRGSTLGNLTLRAVPSSTGDETDGGNDVDRSMYNRYRMVHGLAEGPEIVNKIPLECNLDLLNYISFSKGCYVGQELVARTKHKGLVRKRILPFLRSLVPPSEHADGSDAGAKFDQLEKEIADAISSTDALDLRGDGQEGRVEAGAKVVKRMGGGANEDVDVDIGSVVATTRGEELGLAMLRLEHVFSMGGALSTSNGTNILAFKPSWWPDVDPVTGKALDAVS
jgi:folate-binding protein YgfZ